MCVAEQMASTARTEEHNEEHKRLMSLNGPEFFAAVRAEPPFKSVRDMIPIITLFKEHMIRKKAARNSMTPDAPIITISDKEWPGGDAPKLSAAEMEELKAAIGTEVRLRVESGRWEDKDISNYYFYDIVMRAAS